MFWFSEDMPFPDDLEHSFHNGSLTNVPVSCRVHSGPLDKPAVTLLDTCQSSKAEEGSSNNFVIVPDEEEDLLRPSQSMEQQLSGVTEELEFYSQKDSEKCSLPNGIAKNIKDTGTNPRIGTIPVTDHDWPNGSISAGHNTESQCVIFLPRIKSHTDKHSRRKRNVKWLVKLPCLEVLSNTIQTPMIPGTNSDTYINVCSHYYAPGICSL